MGRPFVDLVGTRYGRLVVTEYTGKTTDKNRYRLWRCLCDCGTECVVNFRELSRGHTRSCGCLFRETIAKPRGKNALPEGESAFNQFFYLYQKSARERGYEFLLTKEEFRTLTDRHCEYCGAPPTTKYRAVKGTNGNYYGNGIDRIDNSLGYTLGNVRTCCKQCNISKGVLPEQEFLRWVASVVTHLKLPV